MEKPQKRGGLYLIWAVEPENNPGECQVSFLVAAITLSVALLGNKYITSR